MPENPGIYVKDLSKIGRNLKDVIIVDNSPHAYIDAALKRFSL